MTFWERFPVSFCYRVGFTGFSEEFWSYTSRCVWQFSKGNEIIDAVGTTDL